jgi:hypothetical protein
MMAIMGESNHMALPRLQLALHVFKPSTQHNLFRSRQKHGLASMDRSMYIVSSAVRDVALYFEQGIGALKESPPLLPYVSLLLRLQARKDWLGIHSFSFQAI